jgi:hypothetical protein
VTVGDVIAACTFAAWAGCTLLVHVPALKLPIRRRDVCALVPEWNFFAPRPAEGDYVLLHRDHCIDGSLAPWRELRVAAPRRWWNAAWNPTKRNRKALFDAVTELALHVKEEDPTIIASIPYLTLLNYVSGLPRSLPVARTQVLLMMTAADAPDDPPRPMFLSSAHDL